MLCPVFPDVLERGIGDLVDAVRPPEVEHLWAEVYNDRANWEIVRDGYPTGSPGYDWMTEVFERRNRDLYSAYAVDLFLCLRARAEAEGWLRKLRYLLYEDKIRVDQARRIPDLSDLMLQSEPGENGLSTNPAFAELQRVTGDTEGTRPRRKLNLDVFGDHEGSIDLTQG
jgi:hypothetical protein